MQGPARLAADRPGALGVLARICDRPGAIVEAGSVEDPATALAALDAGAAFVVGPNGDADVLAARMREALETVGPATQPLGSAARPA